MRDVLSSQVVGPLRTNYIASSFNKRNCSSTSKLFLRVGGYICSSLALVKASGTLATMKELNRDIADREPTYLNMVLQPTGEAGQSSSPPAPRGEGECRCEGDDTTTPRPPSRVDWGLTHSPLSFFCLKTCK